MSAECQLAHARQGTHTSSSGARRDGTVELCMIQSLSQSLLRLEKSRCLLNMLARAHLFSAHKILIYSGRKALHNIF